MSFCYSVPTMRTRKLSSSSRAGQIQLIFGPMFSGKSTELIRRLKRYQVAQYTCLIVKYAKDVRYDDESIATHDRQTLKAVSAVKLASLSKFNLDNIDVVGIDEGQFFPDVVDFCEDVANRGKIVIVAALDGTFERKSFANMMDLVPLAENLTKLTAVCMSCFGEGSYTKRISDDKEVEVIGGAEKYMAVCRRCYFAPVKVAASPRAPLKTVETNGQADNVETPHKRALFDVA